MTIPRPEPITTFCRPSDMTPLELVCDRAENLAKAIAVHGLSVVHVAVGRAVFRHAYAVLPSDLSECFRPCASLSDFTTDQYADAAARVSACIKDAMQAAGEWETL